MTSFAALGVADPIIDLLAGQGIAAPSEPQTEAIPRIRSGASVLLQSPTGSGKTLAYLLPLLAAIDPASRDVQVLVLAPTQELCLQIAEQVRRLTAAVPWRVLALIGGANLGRQVERLKEKPQLVVGTPGRIQELTALKKLKLHAVRTVVLDETDRLLDAKTAPEIAKILKATPGQRQLIGVSATLSPDTEAQARGWALDLQVVRQTEQARPATTLEHVRLALDPRDKIDAVRSLVHAVRPTAALVFVKDAKRMVEITEKLDFKGLAVAALHSGARKDERARVLREVRQGKTQVLVATDVAARGLDLRQVQLVINFDLPTDAESYLHRAGRTGRMGDPGLVVSLASHADDFVLDKLGQALEVCIVPARLYRGELRRQAEEAPRGSHRPGSASSK